MNDAIVVGLLAIAVAAIATVIAVRALRSATAIETRLHLERTQDLLTGLTNRATFMTRLQQSLITGAGANQTLALLLIDLDELQTVNDRLGYDTGDEILKEVAERLQTTGAGDSVIGRLAGDQFAALFPNASAVEALVDRMLNTLQRPYQVAGEMVPVSASIGAVSVRLWETSRQDTSAGRVLKDAEAALGAARSRGRGTYAVFDETMRPDSGEDFQLRTELARAIEEGGLRAVYQPIVDLGSGEVLGVEALARWQHGERGEVAPDVFIPAAERAGMGSALGLQILDLACRDFASWKLPEPNFLAVNVSPSQLTDRSLPQAITTTLRRHGLKSNHLVIEVNEAFMADSKTVVAAMAALRSLGVRVVVDSYGTGRIAPENLGELDVDMVKIDRTLVTSLTDGDVSRVEAIVAAGRSNGQLVVAQGIETAHDLETLKGIGCTTGQGFHFSRPLEAASVVDFVTA